MKKDFTVKQMKSAFLAIADELTESQRQMLRTHCLYRVASMGTIAQFGEYDSYRSANLHYAAVGRKIADRLGYPCPHGPMETIATVSVKDKKGHDQWRMDEVVTKALEAMDGPFRQTLENGCRPKMKRKSRRSRMRSSVAQI